MIQEAQALALMSLFFWCGLTTEKSLRIQDPFQLDGKLLITTELFGPFQVITEYKDNEADKVPSYLIFGKGDCNLRANGIALDSSGSQQRLKLLG